MNVFSSETSSTAPSTAKIAQGSRFSQRRALLGNCAYGDAAAGEARRLSDAVFSERDLVARRESDRLAGSNSRRRAAASPRRGFACRAMPQTPPREDAAAAAERCSRTPSCLAQAEAEIRAFSPARRANPRPARERRRAAHGDGAGSTPPAFTFARRPPRARARAPEAARALPFGAVHLNVDKNRHWAAHLSPGSTARTPTSRSRAPSSSRRSSGWRPSSTATPTTWPRSRRAAASRCTTCRCSAAFASTRCTTASEAATRACWRAPTRRRAGGAATSTCCSARSSATSRAT